MFPPSPTVFVGTSPVPTGTNRRVGRRGYVVHDVVRDTGEVLTRHSGVGSGISPLFTQRHVVPGVREFLNLRSP